MAEQFNQKQIAHKSDSTSETEFSDRSNSNISRLEASRHSLNYSEDDLINSLQNRRENRRARQVFEWETARRQTPPNYLRGIA